MKTFITVTALCLMAPLAAGPGALEIKAEAVKAIEIKDVRPIDPPGGSGGSGGSGVPSTAEEQNGLTFTPQPGNRDAAPGEGGTSLEAALEALGIPQGDDPTARFSEALQLVQGIRQELAQLRAEERRARDEMASLEQTLHDAKTQPWKSTMGVRLTLRSAREAFQAAQAKAAQIQARADRMEQALGTLVQWVGAVTASDAAHAASPAPLP